MKDDKKVTTKKPAVMMKGKEEKKPTTKEEKKPVFSCFDCNSENQDFCDDPFDPNSEGSKAHLKDCMTLFNRTLHPNGTPPKNSEFFCRKITQDIAEMGDKYPANYRIIRSCAFEEGRFKHRDCYNTATNIVQTRVCKCYGSECNPASGLVASLSLILVPVFFTLIQAF